MPVKVTEPAGQGKHHHPESIDFHLKEQAISEAKTYLGNLVVQLRQGPLQDANLTLTWSIATGKDVANTLIRAAETGKDAEGTYVFGGCDLIVLAIHGRGSLERWMISSVTEHILGATVLPMLIVRTQEQHVHATPTSQEVEAKWESGCGWDVKIAASPRVSIRYLRS